MSKREEARKAKAKQEADNWNEQNPVGATVEFIHVKGFSQKLTSRTVGVAYVSESGEAVVHLRDKRGYVLLSHCTVIPAGVAEPQEVGGE